MLDLSKVYLYRMTHLQNIPHILEYGITHHSSPKRNPNYVPIGDGSLITTRNSFVIPNGSTLGEYIPFYFGPRMPMLFVIQKGLNGVALTQPENIVYCITSVADIEKCGLDYVFTDGHAVNGLSGFYIPSAIKNLRNLVKVADINCRYWNDENDLDLKRRKEAEFLVRGDIPATAIRGFVVYNETIARQLQAMPALGAKGVIHKPDYYF